MKRLKKGFTLIELLVVIAIIGILATTLAPKLREQLAKAKDAKGIAVLGAARTVGSALYIDKMVQATGAAITLPSLSEIRDKVDKKAQAIVTSSGAVTIGGIRQTDGAALAYGGTVNLEAKGGNTTTTEEFEVNFKEDTFSSENKKWSTY